MVTILALIIISKKTYEVKNKIKHIQNTDCNAL